MKTKQEIEMRRICRGLAKFHPGFAGHKDLAALIRRAKKIPNRRFDVNQALRDGGWGSSFEALQFPLKVKDRKTGERATITDVALMPEYGMYQVSFKGGGWLLLDHAVEQYGK